mgnify:CR=1 FL=1
MTTRRPSEKETIVILAEPSDETARVIQRAVTGRNHEAWLISPKELDQASIEWDFRSSQALVQSRILGRETPAHKVTAILLRAAWLGGDAPGDAGAPDEIYGAVERNATFTALFASANCCVINRPPTLRCVQAVYRAPNLTYGPKPAAIPLQDWILTSDLSDASEFLDAHPLGVLALDDDGVMHELDNGSLRESLTTAGNGPVLLFARMAARSLRVYVVGPDVCSEGCSAYWDPVRPQYLRNSDQYVACSLPTSVAKDCVAQARTLGAEFCVFQLAQLADVEVRLCSVRWFPDFEQSDPSVVRTVVDAVADRLLGCPS